MRLTSLTFLAACVLFPSLSKAQGFFGGATAYTPEVSTFTSGVTLSVQGTVSADRKYVTITARPTLTTLLQMQTIQFGGAAATQPVIVGFNPPAAAPANPGRVVAPAPNAVAGNAIAGNVLSRPGMTRVAPVP